MSYKVQVLLTVLFATLFADAVPYVTNVVAKQRYPWGIVDISCEVKGIEEKDKGLEFTVDAVSSNSGSTNKTSHVHFRGEKKDSVNLTAPTNGTYRFVWDANKDIGPGRNKDIVVRVSLSETMVQLWEDGPYWATRNIGANEPWESGYYFWWGDTIGYKRENNKWVASDGSSSNFSFTDSNAPTYRKDISTLQSEGWITAEGVLAPEHDAAKKHCGGDWRMPTKQEFDELNNKCDWSWTIMNGVAGYLVRGRGDYAPNSIFLPCASYGYRTSLYDAGSIGYYWSSVPESGHYACYLHFYSSDHYTSYDYRYFGRSVRPLQGFTK